MILHFTLTSTVKPFQDALKNAEAILNKEDATVSEIEEAYALLGEARKNLVLKASDAEVKVLEIKVASFKEEDYTASSYKAFLPVLEEVKGSIKG